MSTVLLEIAVLGAQAVEGIVGLGLATDEARKDVGLGGTGHTASLVDIGDVNLDGGVILGGNKATSGRAKEDRLDI